MSTSQRFSVNQKGLAPITLIVGILIVIIIAGGAYYLGRQTTPKSSPTEVSQTPQPSPSSTPDASPVPNGTGETANWKTYTNSKYRYSVKYPPSYKISNSVSDIKKLPDSSPFLYVTKDYLGADTCPKFATFIIIKNQPAPNIRAADYSDAIDIKAFLSTKIGDTVKDSHNWGILNKRLANEIIDGLPTFVFRKDEDNAQQVVTKRLIIDNKEYYYIIESCLKTGSEEVDLYNKILSTFKFLP